MPGTASTRRAVHEPGAGDARPGHQLLHQRAEAVTEWLPSLAVCMPLKASEVGRSQLCGESGVPPACCQPWPAM